MRSLKRCGARENERRGRESGLNVRLVEEYVLAQGLDVPIYVEGLWDALRDTGKKILAKAVGKAEQQGATTRSILAETIGRSVADVILAQAKKCRTDLIVLGTHGGRGLSRLVMGGDAERVVRETSVPVLLARGELRGKSPPSVRPEPSPAARETAIRRA